MKENNNKTPSKLFEKLNAFADWFIRITVVNILVITFTIPVITFIPALTAGYRMLSDPLKKEEENIFKGFFKYFKEDFVNKMTISLIIAIALFISIYNNQLYNGLSAENPTNILYFVGFYITMAIVIAIIMITLYIPVVYSEKSKLELGKAFKLSFYLAGKFMFRTFLITVALLIPVAMFIISPFTTALLVFFGVSIPLLINAALTLKVRKFLQTMEEEIR